MIRVFVTYLKLKIAQALAMPILVGLILIALFGNKIFNIPTPTMPTVPFSFQAQAAGGYTNGQGAQVTGSFSFSLGTPHKATAAAMQAASSPAGLGAGQAVFGTKLSGRQASLASRKAEVYTAQGRSMPDHGIRLPVH